MNISSTFLAAAALLLSTFAASAADRFVSPLGKDTNAGTLAAPWKTFQKAANSAKAGDTVFLRAGTYKERVQVNVSGTATAPIIFRNFDAEVVTFDMTGVTPGLDLSPVIRVSSRSYVTLQGFTICNYRTADDTRVPVGIMVDGACKGVQILGNKITAIEQLNTDEGNFDANAHGIAIYGTSATPISALTIDGNTLSNLKLGASEALVVNGNVDGFTISKNAISNCNNIGIDAIGYEGTCKTPALDRARNGVIVANTVTGIDSSKNPAYNGHFTNGGGDKAAAGIYVDGGTKILIERNHVYACNLGVELASEWANGKTDFITVRSNIIRHNHLAGIIMGGYDEERGVTENCTIANNTIYENDTAKNWAGQIYLQFYVRKNTFSNNIIWANSSQKQAIVHYPGSDTATAAQKEFSKDNVFSYNLYFANGATATNLTFQAFTGGKQKSFAGVSAWQNSGVSGKDVGSSLVNPKFATALPASSATVAAFKLQATSPAINSGNPTAALTVSDLDVSGETRLNAGRVDRGSEEF
jgi:hypothetical protein